MLGDDEHRFQCQMLLHFADHGTLGFDAAVYLEEWGYLTGEEFTLLPLMNKVLLFELTAKGRKSVKTFRRIWQSLYVARLGFAGPDIPDDYLDVSANAQTWVFSKKRLEAERGAGRLNMLIKRSAIPA